MHPPAGPEFVHVRYALGKKARVFKAAVALADTSPGSLGPIRFSVWGDGKELWQSKPLTQPKKVEVCIVDVGGVEVLELQVRCEGSSWGGHAVWLDPRLFKDKAEADREPHVDWN
jgi:hypothetical protein